MITHDFDRNALAGCDLQQHPLSVAFPAMQPDEYQALKDSIENIGVQNPITIYEGQVIDGWHRYRAAIEVGMPCPIVELDEIDPRDYVLSQNKHRRHVTASQMTLATVAVYGWEPVGVNQHRRVDTECPPSKTNAELAEIAGVHVNTVKQAKVIQQNAAPEIREAVRAGEIGLPKGAAIAKMPLAEQAAAITKPLPKKVRAGKALLQEDGAPDAAELESVRIAEAAEIKTLQLLLASDQPMADLAAKNTQLEAQICQLNLRISSLMNSNTEYIRTIKSLQSKIRQQAVAV